MFIYFLSPSIVVQTMSLCTPFSVAGHVDDWVLVTIDIIALLSYQMGFAQPESADCSSWPESVANMMIV